MESFPVRTFCDLMSELDQVIAKFQTAFNKLDKWQLDEKEEKDLDRLLDRVKTHASRLGLSLSLKKIDKMTMFRGVAAIVGGTGGLLGYASRHEVQQELRDLKERIQDEMDSLRFFYLPSNLVRYYDEPLVQFGDDLRIAFPSAKWDVEEAGKCIALRRSGGAIFHLMRVAEHVLRCFALQFEIIKERDIPWQAVTDAIRGRLKKYDDAKDPDESAQRQKRFFQMVVDRMDKLRLHTRNPAMHEVGKHTEEEAIEDFENVRALVRQMIEHKTQ